MVWLIGLQQTSAFLSCTPCPTSHLTEQLKRALCRAWIAIGEPEVGVDDAHKCHVRKVVPLGDQLRADDDVRLAFRDRFEFEPHAFDAAEQI